MLTFFTMLYWIALISGVLALLGFLFGRFFRCVPQPDAIYFVTTEDGWRLGLSRYRPAVPLSGAPPVVLCPGFGFSSAMFDLQEEISLPKYLASHGYDVWLADVRGRGLSDKPRLFNSLRHSWTFDDYMDFDIPAFLEEVCLRTGSPTVQWIGVDLGALALLGALSGQAGQRVTSVCALAAPFFFRRQAHLFASWYLKLLARARLEAVVRLLSPLFGHWLPPPLHLWQNRDNIHSSIYRRALVNAVCSFSKKEMLQYIDWLERDVLTDVDHSRDLRQSLATVRTPFFFVAGPRDPLAPVEMIEASIEALPEVEDKVFLVASRMHGMSTNYGHLDLITGRNARRDIFPHLLKWLDLHAGIPITDERPDPPVPEDFLSSTTSWSHRTPSSSSPEASSRMHDGTSSSVGRDTGTTSGGGSSRPAAAGQALVTDQQPTEHDAPEPEKAPADPQPHASSEDGLEEEEEEDFHFNMDGDVPRLPP